MRNLITERRNYLLHESGSQHGSTAQAPARRAILAVAPKSARRTHHELLRNEVNADDQTDFTASPPMVTTIGALGLLHGLCCGILVLLLSGVSLATVASSLSAPGLGLALLGGVGFVWSRRKRCTTSARPKRCHKQTATKR